MKKDNDKQRLLSLKTGSGKTYITINAISQLKKKALIIVDTLNLADQWKNQFLFHTDLNPENIVILSGKESVEKELEECKGKIYIGIHKTLSTIADENINSINKLMNSLKIGIRVFDESHINFGNICKINSLSNVEYTIYLTATPGRSNFLDDSLYSKVFGKVKYFDGKQFDGENYHNIVLYKMDSKPDLEDKMSISTIYGFSQSKWANYISEKAYQIFLETVVNIFKKFNLIERNKKIAIVLPTINLIEKLKDDLNVLYPDIEIGTFIGDIKPITKRMDELNKRIFLTNDKIFDKAVDVPDLEILISFIQLSSTIKTEQLVGRLRKHEGLSSVFIDITDIGFDECIRNSKSRKRFYKKKAKKLLEPNENDSK